jgi:hypothetical protein
MFVPRAIVKVAQVPLLGTGKTDYVTDGQLARASEPAAVTT